jgi:hypothetical protein
LAQLLPSGQCAQRPMFTELNISPVKCACVDQWGQTAVGRLPERDPWS